MIIYMDTDQHFMNYGIEIVTGNEYLLIERHNINTGMTEYRLLNPEKGASGNMDPSIKRYHGWRGTTNNVENTALGVRKVLNQTTFKNGNSRVKLSDDLHPDWE